MNKLEQINKRLSFLLDNCSDDEHSLRNEMLTTLVELGDYVIRHDYWFGVGGFYESILPIECHNEFIALSKRVATLTTTHGKKPYDD